MSQNKNRPQIYVGNYPDSFTKDDLYNLFQDYEGINIEKFFKNERKCFSFISCVDGTQCHEIVSTMDRIKVCGRNLIVRFQKKDSMTISEKRNEKDPKFHSNASTSPMLSSNASPDGVKQNEHTPQKSSNSLKHNHLPEQRFLKEHVGQHKEKHERNSPTTAEYENRNKFSHNTSQRNAPSDSTSPRSSKQSYFSDRNVAYSSVEQAVMKQQSNKLPKADDNPVSRNFTGQDKLQEQNNQFQSRQIESLDADLEELSINDTFGDAASASTYLGDKNIDWYDEFPSVNVLNFPLQTTEDELYELFSDCNPLKVFMVCNQPRYDHRATQALIAFSSKEDATNAIMNYDNTLFNGRTLLVADIMDENLLSELCNFGEK